MTAQSLALSEIYSCRNGSVKLRVTGCTGSDDTGLCGVQHLNAAGTAEISPKTSEPRKSPVPGSSQGRRTGSSEAGDARRGSGRIQSGRQRPGQHSVWLG